MATAINDLPIRWDHFLEERNRPHVEGFRRVEWPNIKRELGKVVNLPEGLEPCWVAPGRAIFWHETISSVVVTKVADDGRSYREIEPQNQGFGPTGDLPANNHSVIAHYLNKGFLLRPPGQEVVEEEAAVSQDEPTQIKIEYICYRHGANRMAFQGWKAYIKHCANKEEDPEYDLPPDVAERAKGFPFYCALHNQGFANATTAGKHCAIERKKRGKSQHPTIDQIRL